MCLFIFYLRKKWPSYDKSFDCLGYTAAFLDVSIAPYLTHRGRCRGAGLLPCFSSIVSDAKRNI